MYSDQNIAWSIADVQYLLSEWICKPSFKVCLIISLEKYSKSGILCYRLLTFLRLSTNYQIAFL